MVKKTKNSKEKKELLEFVQDYLPIEEIYDGVIKTTDGRYIKILEIEPINFNLLTNEEQYSVISSFASWLKISPIQIQFKSITKKADINKHIESLLNDMKDEKVTQCKIVARDYINLVRNVSNVEALTRRFFIIFKFEDVMRGPSTTEEDILNSLYAAETNARAYFGQCGNNILDPYDKDIQVLEILYMFFNRRSCINEPFEKRIERIGTDAIVAQKVKKLADNEIDIKITDYISPRGIDFSHYNYITMDGLYYTYMAIKSDGFPTKVRAGWLSALVNAGDGVDVDVFVKREDRGKTVDRVSRKIRLNKSKARDMQDTSADYEEVVGSISSGYYIKDAIANYNEDLFFVTIIITLSAQTNDMLMWKKQQMTNMLKSMDIDTIDLKFQQEEAFKSVMPLLSLSPDIERKCKRNILTSGVASCYMFTSFEMSDDNGVMLGVNRFNNSLCIVDLFNTKKNKNANMNLIGTSGAGKTFTMQLLSLRMRMRGIQSFILAPIKGHEFRRACNAIGGEFIKIAPGSPNCINIMEIRHTISPEMKLIDEVDYNEMDSMLARKIQQLMTFFALLIPDLSNEEEQMLDEALMKTYNDFGITNDNDSIYLDMNCDPPKMKKMPILGDLYNNLIKNPLTKRIATIISRFVTGSAQSFNQQTNVDLDNKYIVLDLSELKGRLLPVGMFIALDYVWDKVKMDRTKKKAVFIDEIWQLIGASSNEQAAEFCLTIFKTIRGFGGAAISATQDLSDFFGLNDGKYGRAIINNSKNKIILNLEPDEAKYVQNVMKLTDSEVMQVTKFERGEALIHSNNNKIPVFIKASPEETAMITTDRSELAEILERKKAEAEGRVVIKKNENDSESIDDILNAIRQELSENQEEEEIYYNNIDYDIIEEELKTAVNVDTDIEPEPNSKSSSSQSHFTDTIKASIDNLFKSLNKSTNNENKGAKEKNKDKNKKTLKMSSDVKNISNNNKKNITFNENDEFNEMGSIDIPTQNTSENMNSLSLKSKGKDSSSASSILTRFSAFESIDVPDKKDNINDNKEAQKSIDDTIDAPVKIIINQNENPENDTSEVLKETRKNSLDIVEDFEESVISESGTIDLPDNNNISFIETINNKTEESLNNMDDNFGVLDVPLPKKDYSEDVFDDKSCTSDNSDSSDDNMSFETLDLSESVYEKEKEKKKKKENKKNSGDDVLMGLDFPSSEAEVSAGSLDVSNDKKSENIKEKNIVNNSQSPDNEEDIGFQSEKDNESVNSVSDNVPQKDVQNIQENFIVNKEQPQKQNSKINNENKTDNGNKRHHRNKTKKQPISYTELFSDPKNYK